MLQKATLILFFFVFGLSQAFSTIYYVATDGVDTNAGTATAPFLSVQRAQTSVIAGDTVYIRGGNYVMTEAQIALKTSIWTYVTNLTKSGSAGKRINYWAYPGEKPVFDYTNIKPAGYRVFAFMVTGSYIHLKGLEVTGVQFAWLTATKPTVSIPTIMSRLAITFTTIQPTATAPTTTC